MVAGIRVRGCRPRARWHMPPRPRRDGLTCRPPPPLVAPPLPALVTGAPTAPERRRERGSDRAQLFAGRVALRAQQPLRRHRVRRPVGAPGLWRRHHRCHPYGTRRSPAGPPGRPWSVRSPRPERPAAAFKIERSLAPTLRTRHRLRGRAPSLGDAHGCGRSESSRRAHTEPASDGAAQARSARTCRFRPHARRGRLRRPAQSAHRRPRPVLGGAAPARRQGHRACGRSGTRGRVGSRRRQAPPPGRAAKGSTCQPCTRRATIRSSRSSTSLKFPFVRIASSSAASSVPRARRSTTIQFTRWGSRVSWSR